MHYVFITHLFTISYHKFTIVYSITMLTDDA